MPPAVRCRASRIGSPSWRSNRATDSNVFSTSPAPPGFLFAAMRCAGCHLSAAHDQRARRSALIILASQKNRIAGEEAAASIRFWRSSHRDTVTLRMKTCRQGHSPKLQSRATALCTPCRNAGRTLCLCDRIRQARRMPDSIFASVV